MAANINQNTDIILQHHDTLKKIYTESLNEFREVRVTRSAISRSEPSCRMWQLFLCLLNVLERKKQGTISHLISVANMSNQLYPFQRDFTKLIHSLSDNKNNILHSLFIQAKITENVKKIESVDELQQGFNYLGICVLHPRNSRYDVISHYFTIIRMGNQFFLDSAYGSEYIRTPPYLTEVSSDEIQMLITSLSDLRDAENEFSLESSPMKFITYFYNTYFFKGNTLKYPNKEMRGTLGIPEKSAKRFLPISEPEKREIQTVFGGKHLDIYVGLIQDYEQLLDEYITDLGLTFKSSSQYKPVRKYHNNTLKRRNKNRPNKKPLPGHTNGGKRCNSITYKKKRRYS
jgi:hypothetical protein